MKRLTILVFCLLMVGCATRVFVRNQRQMQTQKLHGSYEQIFKSVTSVLQSNYVVIDNADMQTGLIHGYKEAEPHLLMQAIGGASRSRIDLQISLERISEDTTQVRMTGRGLMYDRAGTIILTKDQMTQENYTAYFNAFRRELNSRGYDNPLTE
ncbi:MAG: hypothetical protein P9M15_01720 [Candidatus Electryoneaceae bacterium]|nr:hypothetical protein [Candidatus Electryoneaceae bacterium]